MSHLILPPGHVFAGLKAHHYRCASIDAPWDFHAGKKSRPQHYPRMTDHEIAALPIADLLHPDGAWIFTWTISTKLYASTRSRTQLSIDAVARGWGARYSARGFTWVKARPLAPDPPRFPEDVLSITGYTTRKNCEDCLLFKTGHPERKSKKVQEVIYAPVREHSRKPDESFKRIEQYCDGPRVELFARESRPGWDSWGAERFLFDSPSLDGISLEQIQTTEEEVT